jgi:hypothetical protein
MRLVPLLFFKVSYLQNFKVLITILKFYDILKEISI